MRDGGQQGFDAQNRGAPVTSNLERGQRSHEPQCRGAALNSSNGSGQEAHDVRRRLAWADNLNGDQTRLDSHNTCVADASEGNGHLSGDLHPRTADPSEALLLILADALDDWESQRKATDNRLRSLRQVKQLAGSRAEFKLAATAEAIRNLEHQAELELKRAMRDHPLGPWVQRTVGIGEKQAARLIAAIGDPYMRPVRDDEGNIIGERPRRGPAELWAYCGYAPGQKRQKGVRSNWNAAAKMRAYLCAESCIKQMHSPYRPVYDAARANWADRDTTDLHKHNHALRCVAKAILKDLWCEARAITRATPSVSSPASSPGERAAA